jgi:uncharacterized membrane protein YGL010W
MSGRRPQLVDEFQQALYVGFQPEDCLAETQMELHVQSQSQSEWHVELGVERILGYELELYNDVKVLWACCRS